MIHRIWAGITIIAVGAIALPAVFGLPTAFIWNASPSVPIGLYRLRPVDPLAILDLVAVAAPEPIAAFISDRGYLPPGIPLIKYVAGLPGQIVCRSGRTITVDGLEIGMAREADSLGRSMPVWNGCHRLTNGAVFLMNSDVEDSLDGRYFGPTPRSAVLGQATPVWDVEDRIDPPPSSPNIIGRTVTSPSHTP